MIRTPDATTMTRKGKGTAAADMSMARIITAAVTAQTEGTGKEKVCRKQETVFCSLFFWKNSAGKRDRAFQYDRVGDAGDALSFVKARF